MQNKNDKAIACLKQIALEPNLDDTKLLLLYINLGIVYRNTHKIDSAAYYFKQIDSLLPKVQVKMETKVSAYKSLSVFAESHDNSTRALHYLKQYNYWLNKVRDARERNNVFSIQQKYDFGALQNTMNQKLVQRHRIIIMVSMVAILGLIAFALSKIRLAKMRKQEAEAKANLFHFMQQNMEMKASRNAYAQQLSSALEKNALIMRKLDIYLGNKGEIAYLAALNEAVFEGNDHWEALMKVFDALYPNVRENLLLQYPELTEMEQKDFILSYFNVSREDEALLFNKSVHMVDKWRNGARKN